MKHLFPVKQQTLQRPVNLAGVGNYSGKNIQLRIVPAPEDAGLFFVRTDVNPKLGTIPARVYNVISSDPVTTLGNKNGITIKGVEQVLTALSGSHIDNAKIEVSGPDTPDIDGSVKPFIDLIDQVPLVSQHALRNVMWIHHPFEYKAWPHYARITPADHSKITIHMNSKHGLMGAQTNSLHLSRESFSNQFCSPRRNKVIWSQHNRMMHKAVRINGKRITEAQKLRYPNEYLRNKMVKTMGNLALMGTNFIGNLYIKNPDSAFLREFMRAFLAAQDTWSYVTCADYHFLRGKEKKYQSDKTRNRLIPNENNFMH